MAAPVTVSKFEVTATALSSTLHAPKSYDLALARMPALWLVAGA